MKKFSASALLKESNILEIVFISALFLFFFSDGLNKYLMFKGAEFKHISIIIRAIYELIFFGIIVSFIDRSRFQFLLLFFSWFAIFLTGQLIYSFRIDFPYNFKENISLFNKYFFVLIIYFAAYRFEFFLDKFKRLIKILEYLFFFNSILTILGFLFNIIMFTTYLNNKAYTYRFGYSGIIPVQNEATLFFFIAISYFYYKYFIESAVSGIWKFYIVLASALLLGTKAMYLYLILLFCFHSLRKLTAKQIRIISYIFLGIIVGLILFLLSDYSKIFLNYYEYTLQEKGFINVIFSGRQDFLRFKFFETVAHWTPVNFIIGGQDQTVFLIEMDFFDAFLFFGLLGMIVLMAVYFKTLFRFNFKNPFYSFFTFCFFFIAFFAGHFFASAVNALYLALVCLYFYISEKNPGYFAR